jgi:hypothetical protein
MDDLAEPNWLSSGSECTSVCYNHC